MISLAVIVGHILGERVPKRKLQSNDADALPDEYVTKFVGVFRISIKDQIPLAAKEAFANVGDVACDLRHSSGMKATAYGKTVCRSSRYSRSVPVHCASRPSAVVPEAAFRP
jgi:hypothetical protein